MYEIVYKYSLTTRKFNGERNERTKQNERERSLEICFFYSLFERVYYFISLSPMLLQ